MNKKIFLMLAFFIVSAFCFAQTNNGSEVEEPTVSPYNNYIEYLLTHQKRPYDVAFELDTKFEFNRNDKLAYPSINTVIDAPIVIKYVSGLVGFGYSKYVSFVEITSLENKEHDVRVYRNVDYLDFKLGFQFQYPFDMNPHVKLMPTMGIAWNPCFFFFDYASNYPAGKWHDKVCFNGSLSNLSTSVGLRVLLYPNEKYNFFGSVKYDFVFDFAKPNVNNLLHGLVIGFGVGL